MMSEKCLNFAKTLQSYIDGLEQFRCDFGLEGDIKPDRAFRYLMEDRLARVAPELVTPRLIPKSSAARSVIELHVSSGGRNPAKFGEYTALGLTYEHAVPLSVLFGILVDVRSDPARLWQAIEHHMRIAWVTHAEDDELNRLHYKSKMPKAWEPWQSPWARHEAAGINY
jgi:hypothetical protein